MATRLADAPPRSFGAKLKEFLLGDEKNPLDSRVFHTGSLVAVLAWVGMGADGLSSSCYGPEDAFLALGQHTGLTILLALFVTLAVFTISASYTQIIELFASGGAGGGYLVASRFLGPTAGVVSGSALVIDYVLTVAVSICSAADAFFSFLPVEWLRYREVSALGALVVLLIMNLRGLKESITTLAPIFLVFVVMHVLAIGYALAGHGAHLGSVLVESSRQTSGMISSLGPWATLLILMRAFSLGGGTFTGIEAVSNGVAVLREPRAETGKRTMLYMSGSLAFTAGGLLLCYLIAGVHHEEGRTLNASLLEMLWGGWHPGGFAGGHALIVLTLLSEAGLLIVAAQTGFTDGPRVLSSMAVDSWVPRRFANLSDRLVNQDGIVLMTVAAGLVILLSGANVNFIVIMYSINVFVTFSLSQLGMCRHWLEARKTGVQWIHPLIINGAGLVMTTWILAFTMMLKFKEGGWATLVMTGGLIVSCLLIKRHYGVIRKQLKTLDDLLTTLKFSPMRRKVVAQDVKAPTAVIMVTGYNGLGVHTMFSVLKLFPDRFKNLVFIEVGTIDSSRFKGVDALRDLDEKVKKELEQYCGLARNLGFFSEFRYTLNVDRLEALEHLCADLGREYKDSVFFVGKLVFERETWTSFFLHSQTSLAIQKKLLFEGHQVIVMPIRIRA